MITTAFVPLEKIIQILTKKAFNGNWFNNTHSLNICEGDLIELLTNGHWSGKICEDLKVTETKSLLANQQCLVYEFQCYSCNTSRHLHLRIHIEEHK